MVHQVIDICNQNTKNVNVTCLFHDENFLYEDLAKLYELKNLYVHCRTHIVTTNTLVILYNRYSSLDNIYFSAEL